MKMKHWVVALLPLVLFSCANFSYLVHPETVYDYKISNATYDKAYTSAVKAATQIGMSIFTSDKSTGTFYASKGSGLGELSEMNYLLVKDNNRLTVTLRIKSSDTKTVLNNFITAYGKYVKITKNKS